MKRIQASELEGGDDHKFLVRLYTHVLDRWPDRDGYSHYLGRIDGKPEARTSVIRDVARSEEAKKLDVEVIFPEVEAEPEAAVTAPAPGHPSGSAVPVSSLPPTANRSVPPPFPGRPPTPYAVAQPPAFAAGPALGFPANPHARPSTPTTASAPPAAPAFIVELATLRAQVARLEAEVAALRDQAAARPPSTTESPGNPSLLEDVAQQIDALFALSLAAVEARLVALERGQHGG